jgi:hypothetical protein
MSVAISERLRRFLNLLREVAILHARVMPPDCQHGVTERLRILQKRVRLRLEKMIRRPHSLQFTQNRNRRTEERLSDHHRDASDCKKDGHSCWFHLSFSLVKHES